MECSQRFSGMGLLIVDDESLVCDLLREDLVELVREGLSLFTANSIPEALNKLSEENIHVVILDKNLSPENSKNPEKNGIEAIPRFISFNPRIRILVHTSSPDFSDVVRAMKLGAANYLPKNGDKGTSDLVVEQVRASLEQARILEKNLRLSLGDKSKSICDKTLESRNPLMRGIIEKIKRFSKTDEPMIFLGETGVGKTTFASFVHKLRFETKDAPFIEQSFNALGSQVFESELFGSVKGAFTDAVDKIGYLEAANGGTLFIDEIGEISLDAQAKLLTAIETGQFNRVGESTRKRKSKFRLITATNKNPEDLVRDGKMREDFYARICSFQVKIPPLSERPEDIPEIIKSLLPSISESVHYSVSYEMLPTELIEWVKDNPPKLNIRGIRTLFAHLIVLSKEDRLGVKDFSTWKATIADLKVQTGKPRSVSQKITWKDIVDSKTILNSDFPGWKNFTDELEKKVFTENSFDISKLSQLTRIPQSTLYRRIQKHGGPKS